MEILLRLLTFLPDSVFQNNALVLLLGGLVVVLLLVLLLWGMIGTLIFRIVNPTILRHPWPLRHEPGDQQRIVVLAGSYNPPHNGHLAMLSYLAERYGQVIVAIGVNPDKVYDVTPYERAALVRTMVERHLPQNQQNIRVEVIPGYIWRTVQREGASLFYRGIRTWDKDGSDERTLQILNTWGPLVLGPLWWPIPTRFLEGVPQYNHISSTLIRDLCRNQAGVEEVKTLVPSSIASDIVKLYGKSSL